MCVFNCVCVHVDYDIICKLLDSLTERDLDLFVLILKVLKMIMLYLFPPPLSPSLHPDHLLLSLQLVVCRRNDSLALKVQCLPRGTGKSLSVFLLSRDKHTKSIGKLSYPPLTKYYITCTYMYLHSIVHVILLDRI